MFDLTWLASGYLFRFLVSLFGYLRVLCFIGFVSLVVFWVFGGC